jgi:hypothetical protein
MKLSSPTWKFGKLKQIQARMLMGAFVIPGRAKRERGMAKDGTRPSPHPCPLAALALHDVVAFLDQALALAILAFLLLLDVGALFIGHAIAPRQSNA